MNDKYKKALDDEYCILIKGLYRLMLKRDSEGLTEQEQKLYKNIDKAISKNIKRYMKAI